MLENINKNLSIFRATVLRMQYKTFYNSQNDEPVKSKGRASFLHVKEISSRGDKKVSGPYRHHRHVCVYVKTAKSPLESSDLRSLTNSRLATQRNVKPTSVHIHIHCIEIGSNNAIHCIYI